MGNTGELHIDIGTRTLKIEQENVAQVLRANRLIDLLYS